MNKYFLGFFILTTMIFAGCTTTDANTGYYWGNYSGTLYSLKTNPGDKALDNHIKELQSIIDTSNKKGIRVPPGVHAELGYRLAQINQKSKAKVELSNEIITYPESKPFIERVLVFLGLGE
jgi:hypothetical protein